jgi:hypothetical protein
MYMTLHLPNSKSLEDEYTASCGEAVKEVRAGWCRLVTTALKRGGPIAGYAVLIVAASAVESIHGAIWSW